LYKSSKKVFLSISQEKSNQVLVSNKSNLSLSCFLLGIGSPRAVKISYCIPNILETAANQQIFCFSIILSS
jgi:hypothetical protein